MLFHLQTATLVLYLYFGYGACDLYSVSFSRVPLVTVDRQVTWEGLERT